MQGWRGIEMKSFLIEINDEDVERAERGERLLYCPLYHALFRELSEDWIDDWEQFSFNFEDKWVGVMKQDHWLKFKPSKRLFDAVYQFTEDENYKTFPRGRFLLRKIEEE